jgi:hypothetical protein
MADSEQLNGGMANYQSPAVKGNHRNLLKWIIIGVGGLLIIGAISYLILSGRVYVGVKSPDETVSVRPTTCNELINDYVSASEKSVFSPTEEMQKLAKQVPVGAENDVNCQYIKLYDAYTTGNQDSAEKIAQSIQDLFKQGQSVDGRLPVDPSVNVILNNSGTEVKGSDSITNDDEDAPPLDMSIYSPESPEQ